MPYPLHLYSFVRGRNRFPVFQPPAFQFSGISRITSTVFRFRQLLCRLRNLLFRAAYILYYKFRQPFCQRKKGRNQRFSKIKRFPFSVFPDFCNLSAGKSTEGFILPRKQKILPWNFEIFPLPLYFLPEKHQKRPFLRP